MKVVSDASPLVNLARIGQLALLPQLFGRILIPDAVWREVVEDGRGQLVEELVGKKAQIDFRPMHRADVMATWADISKAERLLGWRPQVSVQAGMGRLAVWYWGNRT